MEIKCDLENRQMMEEEAEKNSRNFQFKLSVFILFIFSVDAADDGGGDGGGRFQLLEARRDRAFC